MFERVGCFRAVYCSLFVFLFASASFLEGADEARVFTNKDGQTIRAVLESVDGDYIEIRREDGRRFTIATDTLSAEDQEFIEAWVFGKVLEDENRFVISARRKDENETTSDMGGVISELRDGFYEVEIENRTGVDLEDIEMRWVIRVERTSISDTGDRKTDEWVKGDFETLEISDREEVDLETGRVSLKETRLKPGYYWVSGAPPKSKDRLTGVYVAVYVAGNRVREYALPSVLVEEGREQSGLEKEKSRWESRR